MNECGVVILAAGAGRRLGGAAKALLRGAEGGSFLEMVWSTSRAAGCTMAVVVVGGEYEQLTRVEAERLELAVAVNPDPSRGMASSVAVGFRYAREHWTRRACRALLWPVDHPRVTAATVSLLLAANAADSVDVDVDEGAGAIVVPRAAGRGGHPTLFAAALWQELADCDQAADGARTVVRADPNRVTRIDVQDGGVIRDVDVPDDLL